LFINISVIVLLPICIKLHIEINLNYFTTMKAKLFTAILLVLAISIGFTSCEEENYTLTLTVNPENAGTVTGDGDYSEGAVVALTATANDDYKFVNWTKGDAELSVDAEYNYTTIAEGVTITANFQKKVFTLGAQLNTEHPGFLSISERREYSQDEAAEVQDKIDILCFYEEYKENFITLAAPGSNIREIFTGETAPEFWETKNQTYFTLPTSEVTIEQFNALNDGDAVIETYYNAEQTSGNRMSKNLQVGDIRCFKTADGTFGILLVKEVGQGENGYAKFEVKTK
jgi:hypothetical protein